MFVILASIVAAIYGVQEEASSVVADLVTSAVRDVAPTYTVRQIFSAITAVGAKDLLVLLLLDISNDR
jgi:presenilin-like A22 family membrane protease